MIAGVVAGLSLPTLLLLCICGVGLIAALALPTRHFASLALTLAVITPSAILGVSLAYTEPGTLPMLGQATGAIGVALMLVVRILVDSRRTGAHVAIPEQGDFPRRVRPSLWAASGAGTIVTAFVLANLFGLVIASFRGDTYATILDDARRQLAYLVALPIGYVAIRNRRDWLGFCRFTAFLGIAATVASVVWWLWANAHFGAGPLESLFHSALVRSSFNADRSVFPFTDDSPNLGAVVMASLAAFVAPQLAISRRRRDRLLVLLLVISTVLGVTTTQSRTGVVVVLAGLASMLAFVPGKHRVALLAALLLLAIALSAVFSTLAADRALTLNTENLLSRTNIWSQALDAFAASPIVGNGFGFSSQRNFFEIGSGITGSVPNSIHDGYLAWLVDGGLPGAALNAAVLVLAWRIGRRLRSDEMTRPVGLGLACFLIVFMVSMLVGATQQSALMAIITWLFVGVSAGMWRQTTGFGSASAPPRDAQ